MREEEILMLLQRNISFFYENNEDLLYGSWEVPQCYIANSHAIPATNESTPSTLKEENDSPRGQFLSHASIVATIVSNTNFGVQDVS